MRRTALRYYPFSLTPLRLRQFRLRAACPAEPRFGRPYEYEKAAPALSLRKEKKARKRLGTRATEAETGKFLQNVRCFEKFRKSAALRGFETPEIRDSGNSIFRNSEPAHPGVRESVQPLLRRVMTSKMTAAARTPPRIMYWYEMPTPSKFMPLESEAITTAPIIEPVTLPTPPAADTPPT